MEEQRDFKGVWIPKEIWLDKRLNALEKTILIEIDSLDNENGCYSSNKYLADFCQCSETKVSLAITKLIKLEYLYLQSFDGRTRILKSRLSKNERQTYINCKADLHNMKDNNINNTNNKTSNKENIIKEIFEYWNSKKIVVHKTLTDEMKKQITKSLKQYSIEEIKTYIDRYSKVINDTTYMYDYKWTLVEFLSRKNGISSFADDGSKWINYNNYLNNNNNKYKVQQPKPKQDCPYDVKKIGLHFD